MTPNKLHPPAMALLKVLLEIQGAASRVDVKEGDDINLDHTESIVLDGDTLIGTTHPIAYAFKEAIATAHNTQPTLLAIVKGSLERAYDNSKDMSSAFYGYWHEEHELICTQLSSMDTPGAETELLALREALTKEN